jgi:two-component system, chemotaxis family, sensor kinase CheA
MKDDGMEKILDQLASGVIAGPDDLMGMGECLNLLDQLELEDGYTEKTAGEVALLRVLFNRLILEESPDVQSDWRDVQTLISGFGNGNGAEEPKEPAPEAESTEVMAENPDGEPDETDWDALMEKMSDAEPAPEQGEEKDEPGPAASYAASAQEPGAESEGDAVEISDPELLKEFIEEAREHLSSIELNMLSLEADPGNQEAINAVFRPFHSIKGVAGFLNLTDIQKLSHEVENLLDGARSGKLLINESVIDIVLGSADILKGLLEELEGVQEGKKPVLSGSPVVRTFVERVRNFSADNFAGDSGPVRKVGQILVEHGVVEPEAVEEAAEKSKASGRKLGEEIVLAGLATSRDVSSALREQRQAKDSAGSVRIDTHKLDNLVDMVGELVIAQTMVIQNPEIQYIKDQKFQKDTVQLNRITAELQRISMSMRMVPIKATFQKMIRLIRDLSRKSGKEVSLVMKGEETEIDRNMVEEIYEPLVHMIRNSVDHGIETPDERIAAGKQPSGTIILAAEQKGGNIVIDIEDDGKGLDVERIRAKGIERGIISAGDQHDERAIFELIMHPGFSTRDQVTDVSGRGVGMDVVKKSVEALQGKVEIASVQGKGTHFQLKLPLTMAIIDGMIIQIGPERYVIPTIALKESLRPKRESYFTIEGKGEMIKVRDTLMPLVRLHKLFRVEPKYRDPWEGLLMVVTEGRFSYCLLADEIVGRQEVVIKSLGSSFRQLKGVSGGAILGDGKVALIMDVKGILNIYEENA